MNKVSLREIVGTKIVYAIILVSYYWMWARLDWKAWYSTAQRVLGIFLIAFFMIQSVRITKFKKEGIDELALRNLKRCDSICFKIFVFVMIIVAFGCAIVSHGHNRGLEINAGIIGWIIVLTILALSIIRTIMFIIFDRKGV